MSTKAAREFSIFLIITRSYLSIIEVSKILCFELIVSKFELLSNRRENYKLFNVSLSIEKICEVFN